MFFFLNCRVYQVRTWTISSRGERWAVGVKITLFELDHYIGRTDCRTDHLTEGQCFLHRVARSRLNIQNLVLILVFLVCCRTFWIISFFHRNCVHLQWDALRVCLYANMFLKHGVYLIPPHRKLPSFEFVFDEWFDLQSSFFNVCAKGRCVTMVWNVTRLCFAFPFLTSTTRIKKKDAPFYLLTKLT